MPPLLPVSSVAVQVLQQSKITPISIDKNEKTEDSLVAAANGTKSESVEETTNYWDINTVTPTQMKVKLFEAVGEALGLQEESFSDFSAYASAIQAKMEKMKEDDPLAFMVFHDIEKDLGLDELGLTLESVVEAMIEPGGSDDEALDAALKAKADEINGDFGDDAEEVFGSLRVDSNGIYSLGR